MGVRSAIAVAVVVLLLPGAGSAKSACTVAPLSQTVLRHGVASVRHFRELLARERGADLMGFRRGPRLKPPSAHERSQIEDARSLRRQFGLNPSTLLIRRLIRNHSRRSQVDDDRPWPAEFRVVIRFKGPLGVHRAALRTRFRYHGLLPVRAPRRRGDPRASGHRARTARRIIAIGNRSGGS
jgi:hypothetical protein